MTSGHPAPASISGTLAQCTDVRGHILPGDPVAARGALHETAVFIAQAER